MSEFAFMTERSNDIVYASSDSFPNAVILFFQIFNENAKSVLATLFTKSGRAEMIMDDSAGISSSARDPGTNP